MLDQRNKERIAAEEAVRFMYGSFAQLDLSGFPDLTHPQTETFELRDRYGFNRVDQSGLAAINQLKELLANPPREVVEEIARETGNPELISELVQDRAEEVAREFRRRNPDYLKSESNWRCIVETMAHNLLGGDSMEPEEAQNLLIDTGHWTLANLEAAYKALDRVGALEYPANHSRPLTEVQRLRAEQLAANDDVLGGIVKYVNGRISEDAADQVAFSLADPIEFTSDPAMRPILEEACSFCWEAYRKDYSPSAQRRQFLRDYCGGRFVTVALLDAAWEECKSAERDSMRSSLSSQVSDQRAETPEASPSSLDRLDDAGIENLYHSTLREYAKAVKREIGILT
jgi:hypothetical protein